MSDNWEDLEVRRSQVTLAFHEFSELSPNMITWLLKICKIKSWIYIQEAFGNGMMLLTQVWPPYRIPRWIFP